MLKLKLVSCLLFYSFIFFLHGKASDNSLIYQKVDDGVVIHIKKPFSNSARLIKLQVITDNIIRVLASLTDTFASRKSLMVAETKRKAVEWRLKENDTYIIVSTARVNANFNKNTGSVFFTDINGKIILSEKKEAGRKFAATVVDGEQLYSLKQIFEMGESEGFYGLGQHQEGIMNYKGRHVDLAQNNTEVAIPFLVSDKNFGILWDNYSITQVMDSRKYKPISSLKLFAKDGSEGWLTATYVSKVKDSENTIVRAESKIDYEFIENVKNFPEGFSPAKGHVTWEGYVQSCFEGLHTFLIKYAGYVKVWIDGKLLADRWRQAWNPGTVSLQTKFSSNKKYRIRIEWQPDGGESYLSCKWLSPLSKEKQDEFSFRSEAGQNIDYYFVYGNNLDEVIGGYRSITGRAELMPKWAMGLWQSRERYKTQDEILQTVGEFRKREIPLDNIVLDWSYWKQDEWGSQQFDSSRFSDPAGMIKTLHDKFNTHFMISVWPKFYVGIDNYKYFDTNGWLYKRNVIDGQRDWIGQGYVSTFYDVFNPKARDAFWGLLNKNLFSKGVDAWWLDASEPDIYSNSSIEHKKELMTPTAIGSSTEYFNAYPLQNSKAVYEGQRATRSDQRVFILTRSAYAGLQRYAAAVWSGDIAARWEDFKNQIPAGINFSLSGLPYWTTDIGGFAVEKRYENAHGEDLKEWRELSTRWYQFGAFCPLFRVHGQFPYREIYNISPQGTPAYQSMLYYDKLRYRLMPYIYSLAAKTYYDNYTIMRGLVMDFGNDKNVKNIGDQFMFGPALLVSPVTKFKATERKLYLPSSTGWFDFYTGQYYNGGQQITAAAPFERIPLFVKEGSIIPFGPALQYSTQKKADTITLYVYTGKDAVFTIYDDENVNYNYEKGMYENIKIRYSEHEKLLTLDDRTGGKFNGMLKERYFKIVWVDKGKNVGFDVDRKPDAAVMYSGHKLLFHHE
ncbi:MAG: DUF4968 domain-containing protein [Bacteroidota bacterium]|nr:DUF4968 domain-containing protein [Bacteroidota bacterium]